MKYTSSKDVLFRPFKIGNVTLRNRIAMAPMTRSKSPGGIPTEASAAYYARRAEMGCGLIFTEGTVVGHKASNGYPDVPHFYGDDALAGWRRVAERVHASGGAVFPQLWHVGSVRKLGMQPDPSVPGYGPSPVPNPGTPHDTEEPVEMTRKDIDDVVAAFADSSRHAVLSGFDGVEIHGAHGYLVDQFFWERTNTRTDGYGGSMKNRGRLAVEIVNAVRGEVPRDFPVSFRFSQWKPGAYDAKLASTPDELAKFLEPLADAGVDLFHCSTRRYWLPEFEGATLNLAGWTKKITGKPTVTVGSVGLDNEFTKTFMGEKSGATGIERLLEMMAADEFDIVAIGRMYLCDPALAVKIREDRYDDILQFSQDCLQTLVT